MTESDVPTRAQPPSPLEGSAILPGTVLGGRYRVVAPLGRGGMGVVYRAEDLKLGQAVALKFLPATLRGDEGRRKRLRDEVKLARLVAHPNVCRVWDLAEASGQEFLAMEYVDGEDLASLLRRIGRLPEERAVRMARELCAGLGAVHDQGVLHRDLKPANVMVDGRGRVRLADFGLAAAAEDVKGADVRSGTPAYMSPEQREGREVTVRSDVYSLGLVLYELFTGRPAFTARSAEGAAPPGTHETPSSPSSHVPELDPAIDRAILRCLEQDPTLRPASAVALAASLPGGDPLAAALAAGETPSPELVAAVGGTGGLRPPVALACFATAVAGIALVAWLGDRVSPFFLDLDKPPEVLVHEAQQILRDLGPAAPPVDRAHGFVREGEGDQRRLYFWYRQSPRRLSQGRQLGSAAPAFANPPPLVPGMAAVRLDAHGGLVEYVRVPAPAEGPAAAALDWATVLRQAGLEPGTVRVAAPTVVPPVFADARYAWRSESGGTPIRAEAAAFQGRPVWFCVLGQDAASDETGPGQFAPLYFMLSVLLLAAALARRNLRLGRGDRDGARRLAILGAFWGVLGDGPLKDSGVLEPPLLTLWVMETVTLIGFLWLSYLALEPSVRRRWPDTLVSWTRLLRGRVKDPLVGRDVLLGVLGGVAVAILGDAYVAEGVRWPASPKQLDGGWYALADRVVDCGLGALNGLVTLMLMALLRQLLRRTWAALGVVLLFLLAIRIAGASSVPAAYLILLLLVSSINLGLLIWPGLLAAVVAFTVSDFLNDTLMTTHLGAWYGASAVSGILATLVLAAWGYYAARAGRPLFADPDRQTA